MIKVFKANCFIIMAKRNHCGKKYKLINLMKKKKCKFCKKEFEQRNSLQAVCGIYCASKYVDLKKKSKARSEHLIAKKSLLTHSDYQKLLEPLINKIARLIDYGIPCISCGKNGKPQGGHYHSKGANNSIRFNLHNIHIQDYRCNVELSGNISGYNVGLIKTYGKEYKEYVELEMVEKFPIVKLSVEEIKEKIKISKMIIKDLEGNMKTSNAKERIRLRCDYNLQLGIYN